MKFFFPDSQDQIDPHFNFLTEERPIFRVRQRDDRYAHEVLRKAPFDGILVSKTIVDGSGQSGGRYTLAQRHRLYRVGVREFFRLDRSKTRLDTMGDCGAFSYVNEHTPPFTPDDVIDFYSECGFDLGLSVDHAILGQSSDPEHPALAAWSERQELTLDLAREFLARCRARKVRFQPVGVAQGWDPDSYAASVRELQRIGFRRIAMGGMVPLRTPEILNCLHAVNAIRRRDVQLHLLGITRCDHVDLFATAGVTSFDSTSPFRQSFKDDRDNYYALDRSYTALRVPQVDASPKLKAKIRAGHVDQAKAVTLESKCLTSLRKYDAGECKLATPLAALCEYEQLYGAADHTEAYRETLEDRPWKNCRCGICTAAGINVIIFRGAERNKRRGFHNLFVFNRRLQRELTKGRAS